MSGVVFGGDLELLDSLLALLVKIVEASLVTGNLVVKELGADLANTVNPTKGKNQMSAVVECAEEGNVQDWPARNSSIFLYPPAIPSKNQGCCDRIE